MTGRDETSSPLPAGVAPRGITKAAAAAYLNISPVTLGPCAAAAPTVELRTRTATPKIFRTPVIMRPSAWSISDCCRHHTGRAW